MPNINKIVLIFSLYLFVTHASAFNIRNSSDIWDKSECSEVCEGKLFVYLFDIEDDEQFPFFVSLIFRNIENESIIAVSTNNSYFFESVVKKDTSILYTTDSSPPKKS